VDASATAVNGDTIRVEHSLHNDADQRPDEADVLPPSRLLEEGRALIRSNALHFRRTHCS